VATRLYLQSTGNAPFTPAAADGGWERNATGHAARLTSTTKANTPLTTLSSTFGATQTSQTRFGTWVSPPLAAGQTIAGTVSLVVGKCAETTTSGDAHLAFAVRVVDGEGTHRATLATVMGTSTEFPLVVNAATRIHSGAQVSSFAANAGDRLVLELGVHGVTPANETMQMRVGDPSGTADFALTAALTTDLVPWVELSQTLSFGTPGRTAATEGVSTSTVTANAKRLLAVLAIAGTATTSATIAKATAPTTTRADGTSTAVVSAGRLRGAATSATGQSTTTATIGRLTVTTSTATAQGTSATTVTVAAKRLGTASRASGTASASAVLHARRSVVTLAAGRSGASAGLGVRRQAAVTLAGHGGATATLSTVGAAPTPRHPCRWRRRRR
jgi:hypothetical protein